VAHAEDPIMDDERARRHGAAGSISAAAGNGSAGEPQQLVLWSAAPHEQPDKRRPAREAVPAAPSKFLLIEPVVAGARAPSAPDHAIRADDEIRPPRRDEFARAEAAIPAQWVQFAVLGGALAVGLCLGWIGGSMSARLFAPAPSAAPMQQAEAPGCTRDGGCAAKSDREAMASPTKLAGPRARIVNRERELARGTQQANAAGNRDVATTNSISTQERTKVAPRFAAPETRPTTIEGWSIREVVGGTAVLQGPTGLFRAAQGDTVPGVGRVDSIVRWGSRWIVATTRGLISTVD
jgi:hypothetical protein